MSARSSTRPKPSAPVLSEDQFALIIKPGRGWASLGLGDIWEYRELLYFIVWREVKGMYRQTALGVSWLFLRPLILMVIFSIVFGWLIRVPTDGIPYPLFALAALLPWGFFSQSVSRAARSLVDATEIISKVYFPRMVMTLASVGSALLDLAASFGVLLVALLFYRMPLRWEMLLLPLFTLLALGSAIAMGLWVATLSVKYRDVSFGIHFILQAMMYASPVVYPASLVPERFRFIYHLNPMASVIEGFRWALLGNTDPPGIAFAAAVVITLLGLLSGAYVFRRTERTIVDIL